MNEVKKGFSFAIYEERKILNAFGSIELLKYCNRLSRRDTECKNEMPKTELLFATEGNLSKKTDRNQILVCD